MSRAVVAACTWKTVGGESSSALGEGLGWRVEVGCVCVCVGGVHSVNLLHKSHGCQRREVPFKRIGRGATGEESSEFGSE